MILNQAQFTFKKTQPIVLRVIFSSCFELPACRGRGGGEGRKLRRQKLKQAAENRKHFIRPEVRFLACKQKSGGNRGGYPHLGTVGKHL